MSLKELMHADTAASKINDFVRINAAAGLSPCVIGLLACSVEDDYDVDVEVRALLFVECWKDGFYGIDIDYVDMLRKELQECAKSFSTLNYPTVYWISE